MIEISRNKIVGLYAEAIAETVKSRNTVETATNVAETLYMLSNRYFNADVDGSDRTYLNVMGALVLASIAETEHPYDTGILDDEIFWDHIGYLIEHQDE